MTFHFSRCLLAALLLPIGLLSAAQPPSVKLPLVLWDMDFNRDPIGLPPQALTKAQIEAQSRLDTWRRFPMRTYSSLQYVTRTRTAVVEKAALGLKDKPVVFTFTENAQPHYGPQMGLQLPADVAAQAKRLRLSIDAAMGSVAMVGGIRLWDVVGVEFHGDGSVRANGTGIARYQPHTPLHFEFLIDVTAKTVTITVDGKKGHAVTTRWYSPRAAHFGYLRLDGLLPGGHAWPGRIAFDNIKLVLEETF